VSDEIHQISVNLVIALAGIAHSVNWSTATATKIKLLRDAKDDVELDVHLSYQLVNA
jgi:hypothetical protein